MSFEHSPSRSLRRYRRSEASEYLREVWGISRTPNTLAKEAVRGDGPGMEYDGRLPLYPEDALDAYAREHLGPRVRSTSERRELAVAK